MNLIVIAVWGVPLLLMVFIATRKKWRGQVRAVLLLLLAGGYMFLLVVPAYKFHEKKDKAQAEAATFREEAYAYFHKKCAEDSGRFIYKTVTEPQESVYMMKPRKKPTYQELRDQFWMGDPYGATTYVTDMPERVGLLDKKEKTAEGGELPLFSFVEIHDLDHPDQLWRYYPTDHRNPDNTCPRGEKWFRCEAAESIQSRYGFTWDDLSTGEDRNYWVAKSRLQIIDLQTKEVIAERVGYVIEEGFGSVDVYRNGTPWLDTDSQNPDKNNWKRNFCPPRRQYSDAVWIRSSLNNLPFSEK